MSSSSDCAPPSLRQFCKVLKPPPRDVPSPATKKLQLAFKAASTIQTLQNSPGKAKGSAAAMSPAALFKPIAHALASPTPEADADAARPLALVPPAPAAAPEAEAS